MNHFFNFLTLLALVSVLLPFTGLAIRVVRKLTQALSIPTFLGCIFLLEGFGLGKFRVGENTKKRFPQESLATIHLILCGIILYVWYHSFKNQVPINEMHNSLTGLYLFNILCLVGVILISLFSKPPKNEKDWIDKMLEFKFSLGFYKNLTE